MVLLEFTFHESRSQVHEILSKKAKKIKRISNATHSPVELGYNVIIQITNVDEAKADFQNVIGIVVIKYLHNIFISLESRMENSKKCISGKCVSCL